MLCLNDSSGLAAACLELRSPLCLEDLEDVALQVAVRLAETACWFMGPGHLCGYPTASQLKH